MKSWHALMSTVLRDGERRNDRTGIGTKSLFGASVSFDLRIAFPAVTTKQLAFGQVASELAAFIAGAEALDEFHAHGCKIWDGNAEAWRGARKPGDVGRIYGVQWRRWRSMQYVDDEGNTVPRMLETGAAEHREIDQLANLVEGLRKDPQSRRHIITAWNPGELDQMCLPPCHTMMQFYVSGGQWLDLRFDMRSVDLFLGWPFDVASYALLLHLVAREVKLQPRYVHMSMGDAHVYINHLAQVAEVLSREPLPQRATLLLSKDASLFSFEAMQASLMNYKHCGPVSAPLNI